MWILLALACADKAPGGNEGDSGGDSGGGTTPSTPQPVGLAELSDGECPDMSTPGKSSFSSNGIERSVYVLYPEDRAEDLPVVFVWHPLGGSAQYMVNAMDLEERAESDRAIYVVPDSDGTNIFEWGFLTGGGNDLVLYDDLRTCVANELAPDITRFYLSGFSAGALWTSYLSMQRGDTLAGILVFSGGTGSPVATYTTPASPFPAILLHGGDNDIYGGGLVDFQTTTLDFAANLYADGHFVTLCDHGMGHTIPINDLDEYTTELLSYRYGIAPDSDISVLPSDCSVYTGG